MAAVNANGVRTLSVVDGTGTFNVEGVTQFVHESGVESAGQDYTVVAIMGPQSSGKSTLLNSVFGTRFEEMDALSGRHQTTKGIWLACAPKVPTPPTLVLDLEGSDGRERGEDDTSFERQSALFALAVADVVLVNMWAKDVGRESGAGKPLLKTIFQVNLKLFAPSSGARRTVLLFVFRDRTKTPLEKLTETWEEDLRRMWEGITKPPQYEASSFNDFFDVQYAALSNYEDRHEDFCAESVLLRRRFSDAEEPGTFLRLGAAHKLPGHALSLSLEKVWEVVREHKDLNLPAHRVMVANIRCKEIADEQLAAFCRDQAWRGLAEEASQDLVPGFGQRAADLMESCMAGYDEEARYFDTTVSQEKAEELQEALDALVKPTFEGQLAILRELAFTVFQQQLQAEGGGEGFVARAVRYTAEALEQFDSQLGDVIVPETDWDTASSREQLEREIAVHVNEVRATRVASALADAQKAATKEVSTAAVSLLEAPPSDLWPRLGALLSRAVARAGARLDAALEEYALAPEEAHDAHAALAAAARRQLGSHAREAANTALSRVKDRFNEVFQRDQKGLPRTWQPSVDIPAVTGAARRAAATLLAQLAVVRLEPLEGQAAVEAAAAEAAVVHLAEEPGAISSTSGEGAARRSGRAPGFDLLAATEWPGVPEGSVDALLTPAQVRTTWRQFKSDSDFAVQQAMATQEANRAAQNRAPPLWAIAAMVVLGFNEFLAVLYNPLWLLLLLVLFLFGKTVYQELDVESEMQRGLLPGTLSISAKFMPTLKKVTARVVESGKQLLAEGGGAAEDSGISDGTRGSSSSLGSITEGGAEGGATRRPAAEGLRSRGGAARQPEIELAGAGGPSFASHAGRKHD